MVMSDLPFLSAEGWQTLLTKLSLLSFGPDGWGEVMLAAAGLTVALAVTCIPFGLSMGLGVALAARSRHRGLRLFATTFSTVFRGLPELLTLFIIYYGLQITFERITGVSLGIPAFVAALIAFSLVFAAFSSEVWLGAFNGIDKGQFEAAEALGMSRRQVFVRVIFPQLCRIALPGLSNNWLSMFKDTSLVSSISLVDIMRQSSMAVSKTKEPMVFYIAACVLYLFFTVVSTILFSWLEKRYSLRHGDERS